MDRRYYFIDRTTKVSIMILASLTATARAQSTDPVESPKTPEVGYTQSVLFTALRGLTTDLPAASSRAAGNLGAMLHGEHQAVSRALIDPTYTHHAILEDELRVNLFSRSRGSAVARNVATLELAYAFSDVIGAELFVPYSLPGNVVNGGEILDIEAQPLKVSFLRRPNLIMTAVAGVLIPVGPVAAGEERTWRFEPHLFTDVAIGPVALQGNVIGSFGQDGEHELEILASVARMSFFSEYNSSGPLLETVWEIPLAGEPAARVEPFLAPGIKLQLGAWYFGASYLFPLRGGSAAPSELALTAGYHVSFLRRSELEDPRE